MAEIAPMLLLPWGELAEDIAALIKQDERVLRTFAMAPPRAIHCYAAWLSLPSQQRPANPAAYIRETAPRKLLEEATGTSDVARLWQLLDRLPRQAQKRDTYQALNRLASSELGQTLSNLPEITQSELDFLAKLQPEIANEPLLIPAAAALV